MHRTVWGMVGVAACFACCTTHAEPSIIQPSLKAWADAAKTGRADGWFLGDSIAGTFDAGFSDAMSKHFGLAGTGVGNDFGGGNGSYVTTPPYPLNSQGWDWSPSAVRADRQDHVLSFGEPITAGASPAQFYTTFINPGGYLDPQAAYDWHLWTASPNGGGSMQARRYVAGAPVSVPQLNAPIPTNTPAAGLQHSVSHFDALGGYNGMRTTVQLVNTTDTSVLYSRLVKPGATGATLTTWGYGGHNAYEMYQDKYLGGPTSQAGRGQFLSAMTEAGSGKLMVTIEEGTNDASPAMANVPSIHGILPGNSPAAFADNVTSLVDGIKSDWIAAGQAPTDLSFLVLGMYDYGGQDADSINAHLAFTHEMFALAQSRSDVSFIDLHDIAPAFAQAFALGYMADNVHATTLGGVVYSNAIFDQIDPIPEPSTALLLLCAPILLRRRSR